MNPTWMILFLVVMLAPFEAQAQRFDVDWHATASGGGTSTGTRFAVSATVGQPGVEVTDSFRFEVTPGFWAIIYLLQEDDGPYLRVVSQDGTQAVLAWPVEWVGYSLESCDSLTTPAWSDESGTPTNEGEEWHVTVTLPPSGPRFYRLKK